MGSLYEWFVALLGLSETAAGYNSDVVYCACVCAIVLFCVAVKLIFRGFSGLFGYNKIQ